MNNSLNEYLRFNFELNIELDHFLARFKVKMIARHLFQEDLDHEKYINDEIQGNPSRFFQNNGILCCILFFFIDNFVIRIIVILISISSL